MIGLEDPRQFWETLEAVAPDMLILDSELSILFLTGYNDTEMVNQVFSVAADDIVNKPIVGRELVTRVVNRLERMKLRQRVKQGGKRAEGFQ